MSQIGNVLGGTPDKRYVSALDGGRSLQIGGGGGGENAEECTMDGGNQASAHWTFPKRPHTMQSMYRSCCALSAFITVHSEFS